MAANLWLIVLVISTINNISLTGEGLTKYFMFVFSILAIFILQYSNRWYVSFRHALMFFSMEHFMLAWVFWIFPDFYNSKILPLFSNTLSYTNMRIWSNNRVLMGLTSHYSTSGVYFAIATIVFFAAMLCYKRSSYKILFLLMVFSLFMTQKRGPFLFAILTCAITYIVYNNVGFKTIIKLVIMLLGIGLTLLLIINLFPDTRGLITRIIQGTQSNDITGGRMKFYVYAVELFKQHPMFGIGWGHFQSVYGEYSGIKRSAHNIYLQMLAEVGLVGTTFLIFVFGMCLYKGYQAIKRFRSKNSDMNFAVCFAFASQVNFLLYGITGNPLYDVQCFVPYLLGIAMMCSIYLHQSTLLNQQDVDMQSVSRSMETLKARI